jgi:SAM-dependent methyltransferase
MTGSRGVCDYEGSDYANRFWDQQGREYEDQVERIALRRLLPPTGDTLIDIGAGFGRLADEFDGYKRVVLFDYSRSLLREAQARFGDDPRFIYVAGNWYQMPFVAGLFDALVQIRTIHHATDVPALFSELARIARPEGEYVLEFASKRHLKAILRYWLGRQKWSPFSREPLEFVELNFDFHPQWMDGRLIDAGFQPGRVLTVSHLRLPLLKKVMPTRLLVRLDSLLQNTARWWQLTPSLFIASQAPVGGPAASDDAFFSCPACGAILGEIIEGQLSCPNETCHQKWRYQDGLYDFKEPQPDS